MESLTVKVRQLMGREISIFGNSANTVRTLWKLWTWPAAAGSVSSRSLQDEFKLSQLNEAIDKLRKHEILGRAVVKP